MSLWGFLTIAAIWVVASTGSVVASVIAIFCFGLFLSSFNKRYPAQKGKP